jgi:hypothetical protein
VLELEEMANGSLYLAVQGTTFWEAQALHLLSQVLPVER